MMSDQLSNYLESLVPERPAEMVRMEGIARENGFPIIGPAAGYACYQLARMTKAQAVFEMGSGYGYSTAWFAQAVRENGGGVVHHTVWDEALSRQAHGHLQVLGYNDLVHYTVGEAIQALKKADGPFDLIFNDINKQDYPASLAVIGEKLRPGGLLIIDNGLWHGRIFDASDQSRDTEGVREVTRSLVESDDWITTLLPIRDGLIVAYRQ